MRGTIRDIMRYRSRSFETHEDQLGQARTFLEFLTKSLGEENSPYALMLRRELEAISKSDDYYLHHEHLEDTNQPVYFHEFMKQAQQFQMEYVCEADFGSSYIEKLPDNIKSMLVSVSHDRIELEQYLDFLRNRTFRQTILCHSSRKPTRQPQIDSLNRLYVSSNAIPEKQNYDYRSQDELLFRRRDARLKTTDPLVKVAFSILEKRWPQRVPFKELASVSRSIIHDRPIPIDNEFMTGETQRFAKTILDCFSSSLVDLHSDQSLCDSFPSDTPLAKPLQIQQANQSAMVTTLIHTEFQMDEFQRQLIQLCDGTKDRDQIVTAMVQLLENGKLTIYGNQGNKLEPSEDISETLKTYVNRTIDGLWKNGLLSSSK
ncbi:methyltransferase regulatory domain-containing protein [uncultured Rubinisphaera sp.]|uniref:methyltransferase regulatory domain-containing protein n=1 Tax=uncultured Rubinisphaera sp. TaxID=1678686 RepID=UPI0030D963C7